MNTIETFAAGVQFEPGYSLESLHYDEKQPFGFMRLAENGAMTDVMHLVGFAMPFDRRGGFDTVSATVTAITELADVPPEFQTIDIQGKGVGTRLFNTQPGARSMAWCPQTIGMYVINIPHYRLFDYRIAQGSKYAQTATHAGRMVASKLLGLEKAVRGIHDDYDKYGDMDAFLLNSPPLPEHRRRNHNDANPSGVTSSFLIPRSDTVTFTKLGQVTRSNA